MSCQCVEDKKHSNPERDSVPIVASDFATEEAQLHIRSQGFFKVEQKPNPEPTISRAQSPQSRGSGFELWLYDGLAWQDWKLLSFLKISIPYLWNERRRRSDYLKQMVRVKHTNTQERPWVNHPVWRKQVLGSTEAVRKGYVPHIKTPCVRTQKPHTQFPHNYSGKKFEWS